MSVKPRRTWNLQGPHTVTVAELHRQQHRKASSSNRALELYSQGCHDDGEAGWKDCEGPYNPFCSFNNNNHY